MCLLLIFILLLALPNQSFCAELCMNTFTPGNQSFCTSDIENEAISWCSFTNKFLVPFESLTPQDLSNETVVEDYCHDGVCVLYRMVRTLEFFDPYDPDYPWRIIILGKDNGELVGAYFNWYLPDDPPLPSIAVDGKLGGGIIAMDTLVLKKRSSYVLAASKGTSTRHSRISMIRFYGEAEGSPGMEFCIENMEIDGFVLDVKFIPFEDGTHIGLCLLVQRSDGFVMELVVVEITAGDLASCVGYTAVGYAKLDLPEGSEEKEFHFQVFLHQTFHDALDLELDHVQQDSGHPLIVVHSSMSVSIFSFQSNAEAWQGMTVPFGKDQIGVQNSQFFVAALHERIDSVHLFGEHLRRLDTSVPPPSQTCELQGLPTPALWLAIGSSMDDGSHTMHVVSLAEFAFVNYTGDDLPPSEIVTNPAHKVGPAAACVEPLDQWYNPIEGACVARRNMENTVSLMGKAVSIQSGYRHGPSKITLRQPDVHAPFNVSVCAELLWEPTLALACYERASVNTSSCEELYGENSFYSSYLQDFEYTTLFVADASRTVHVVGFQPEFCSLDGMLVNPLNEMEYLGDIIDVHVSPNTEHLFVTISRAHWEIQSLQRRIEICNLLKADSFAQKKETQMLGQYKEECIKNPPHALDLNLFGQYASMCKKEDVYCPSLEEQEFYSEIVGGWYAIRPNCVAPCESGFYCTGDLRRYACPMGFVCPYDEMSAPERCFLPGTSSSLTCAGFGLREVQACPPGEICSTSYSNGLLAPPGYKVSHAIQPPQLERCEAGEWCCLGSIAEMDNSCLVGSFCATPSVIVPEECDTSSKNGEQRYCPPRSTADNLCPAGEYVNEKGNGRKPCCRYCPSVYAMVPCSLGTFCPPGTSSASPCPPGYFCRSPKEKEECPRGSFCRAGSFESTPCHIMTICPSGTKDEGKNVAGIILDVLLLLVAYFGWKVYKRWRGKLREEREKQREKMGSTLTSPLLGDDEEEGGREMSVPYHLESEDTPFTIDFDFHDLRLEVPGAGCVLNGVTGRIRHGRVCAVMGPSGAGKTTFLSVLAGKATYGVVSGTLLLNHREEGLHKYRKVVGFVPQDDIMLREMTVKEVLLHSAATRLGVETTNEAVNARVNEVLHQLGLYAIRHSVIGDESRRGISGGQRKRVNIGMELVMNPTVLLLDEPTSGLDSTSSMEVVEVLREIAPKMTIVLVLHQPRYEIFRLFHDVLLLGPGGKTVYLGPSGRCIEYFEGLGFPLPPLVNPPDHFMDVIAGLVTPKDHPSFKKKDLFELWNQHGKDFSALEDDDEEETQEAEKGQEMDLEAKQDFRSKFKRNLSRLRRKGETVANRETPGFFKQLFLFYKRANVQQTRQGRNVLFDLFLVWVAALFLGLTFQGKVYEGPAPIELIAQCPDTPVNLRAMCAMPRDDPIINEASLTTLCLSLTSIMAGLRVFGNEKVVYWREAATGSNKLAYFLGKNFSQLPNLLISPLVFLSIFYALCSPRGLLKDYYVSLIAIQFAASGLAYVISAYLKPQVAQLAGVVAVLILQMFAGARPSLRELKDMAFPLNIFPTLSYMRWAMESIYLAEIKHYEGVYNIATSLTALDYSLNDRHKTIQVVFIFGVFFRCMAFAGLVFKDRKKMV